MKMKLQRILAFSLALIMILGSSIPLQGNVLAQEFEPDILEETSNEETIETKIEENQIIRQEEEEEKNLEEKEENNQDNLLNEKEVFEENLKKPEEEIETILQEETSEEIIKNNQEEKIEEEKGKEDEDFKNNFSIYRDQLENFNIKENRSKEDEIKLDKIATPVPGKLNEWDINLKVEIKPEPKTTDIVLIYDKSSSMIKEGNKVVESGINNHKRAQEASKKFVDKLLTDDENTRIGIVEFGTSAKKTTDFTSNKLKLKSAIDGIKVTANSADKKGDYAGEEEHTFTAAGLREARELMNESTADNKYIILLTDGSPNRSVKLGQKSADYLFSNFKTKTITGKKSTNSTLKDRKYTVLENPNDIFRLKNPSFLRSYPTEGTTLTNTDTHSTIHFEEGEYPYGNSWIFKQEGDTKHWTKALPTREVTSLYFEWSKQNMKETFQNGPGNIPEIYVVGFNISNNLLRGFASSPKHFYSASSSDISPVLEKVATNIKQEITSSIVLDPMGEGFDILKDSLEVVQGKNNQSNLKVDNNEIKWDIKTDDFHHDEKTNTYTAEIKYRVKTSEKAIELLEKGQLDLATNGDAKLEYEVDGEKQKPIFFPKPQVKPTLLKVNKEVINHRGEKVNLEDFDDSFSYKIQSKINEKEIYQDKLSKEKPYSYHIPENTGDFTIEELDRQDYYVSYQHKGKDIVDGNFRLNFEDGVEEVTIMNQPKSKIKAEKTANKKEVKPGDTIDYTIEVKNIQKHSLAKKVLVKDQLPSGLRLEKASVRLDGQDVYVKYTDNGFELEIEEMEYNQSFQITFKAVVELDYQGDLINKAWIKNPEEEDPIEPEELVKVNPLGKITGQKSVVNKNQEKHNEEGVLIAHRGDSLEYTIKVKNIGNISLEDIRVEDSLPINFKIDESSIKSSHSLKEKVFTDNKIDLILEKLESGETAEITFQVKVADDANFEEFTNVVKITNPDEPDKPIRPEVPIVVERPNGELEAEKLVSTYRDDGEAEKDDENEKDDMEEKETLNILDRIVSLFSSEKEDILKVKKGEILNYQIKVRNIIEDSIMNKIQVKDDLPVGLEIQAETIMLNGKKHPATILENGFILEIEKLQGLEEAIITFDVLVTDEAKIEEIVNIAEITDPRKPDQPLKPSIPVELLPGQILAKKQVSKETISHGEIFTYTIEVENPESYIMRDILIEDTMPAGIELLENTIKLDGKSIEAKTSGNELSIVLEELKAGAKSYISFQAKAEKEAKAGNYINKAQVTNPEEPDKPIEIEVPVELLNKGEIELVKKVNKDKVKPGESLNYTIEITNKVENSLSKNIILEDKLPEGLILESNTILVNGQRQNIEIKDNGFSLVIDELAGKESATITFEAQVDLNIESGLKENIARIEDPNYPDKPIESPPAKTEIERPGQIVASKTASREEVSIGEEFSYTIKIKNPVKDSLVKDILIEDKLPEGLDLIEESIESSKEIIENKSDQNKIHLRLEDLAGQEEVEVTFKVRVSQEIEGKTDKSLIVNQASITDLSKPNEPIEPKVPVRLKGQVEARKTVSQKEVRPKDVFTYTIEIENIVEDTVIEEIEIYDKLPEGLELLAKTIRLNGEETPVKIVGDSLQVIVNQLSGKEKQELTFDVRVKDEVKAGELINQALITNPEDPENPIKPAVPVEIKGVIEAEKLTDRQEAKKNEKINYTILVRNIVEDSKIENIIVEDTLPEGLELIEDSIQIKGGYTALELNKKGFKLQLDQLEGGQEESISFQVRVVTDEITKLINTATITNPEDPEKPIEPSVPVDLVKLGKIESKKLADKKSYQPGEIVDYTIEVKNIVEDSTIKNIVIADEMPEGLNLLPATIKVDGKAKEVSLGENSFTLIIEELKGGQTSQISFRAQIDINAKPGEIKNIAEINNPDEPDQPSKPEVPIEIEKEGILLAEKKASVDIARPGESFSYTIRIKNTVEDSLVKNVEFTDKLPDYLSLIDNTIKVNNQEIDNYAYEDGTISLSLEDIKGLETVEISFDVQVSEDAKAGELINIAEIIDPEKPEEPVKPEIPVVIIEPKGEIISSKKIKQSQAKPGQLLDYTIEVTNIVEDSLIKNIEVRDRLDKNLLIKADTVKLNGKPVAILLDEGGFSLTIDQLKGLEKAVISFQVELSPDTPAGQLVNRAEIINPEDPENPQKPSVPVEVLAGKFTSKKIVDKKQVNSGEKLIYTIEVENLEDYSIKNIEVKDHLPEGMILDKESIQVDHPYSIKEISDESFQIVIDKIDAREKASISFQVKTPVYGEKTSLTNTGLVINPEDPENPQEPSVPVTIKPIGEIETEKKANKELVRPGEKLNYTILVRNIVKDSILENITVKDILPEGLELLASSIKVNGESTNVRLLDQGFQLSIEKLKGEEEVEITFEAKVSEKAKAGEILNIAEITNPEEPDKPHYPQVPVRVEPEGKIESRKLVNKKQAKPGELLTYTIEVENIVEDSIVKNIQVKDDLVQGVKLLEDSIRLNGDIVKAQIDENSFSLLIPELKGLEKSVITFQVRLEDDIKLGENVNTAEIINPEDPENPQKPSVPITILPKGIVKSRKTTDKTIVKPGDSFSYFIEVENIVEDSIIEDIEILDQLPFGLSLVEDSFSLNGNKISVNKIEENIFSYVLPNLKGGEKATISFQVILDKEYEGLELVNTAIVTNPEDPENPERPETVTPVQPLGQIITEKLVDKEKVKPGQELEYTIVVENIVDGSVLENIIIKDNLPKGLSLKPATIRLNNQPVAAKLGENSFTLTIDQLEGLDKAYISFLAQVEEDAHIGDLVNIAEIINPVDPDNPHYPQVPVRVEPQGRLETKKLASKEIVKVGDNFTYTIELTNTVEGSMIKDIEIEDLIHPSLILIEDSFKLDGEPIEVKLDKDKNFSYKLEELKGLETSSLSFQVKLREEIETDQIKNIATITNPEDPNNPDKPEVTVVVEPKGDIKVVKLVNRDKAKPGEKLDYTIRVTNTVLGSKLENIKISDTLPKGLKLIENSIKVDGKEIPLPDRENYLETIIPELKGGESIDLTFSVEVEEDVEIGKITNIAEVINPERPDQPLKPQVPVTIEPKADIEAVKLVDKKEVKPGESLEYTIEVTNTAKDSSIQNVIVKDKLPEGLILESASIRLNGKTIPVLTEGENLQITIPEILGGETASITFTAKVALDAKPGQIVNIAEIINPDKPENPPLKPQVPSLIEKPGRLVAEKLVDKELARPGDELFYTIRVKNIEEDSKLENIIIKDNLPEGLTLIKESIRVDGNPTEARIDGNSFKILIEKLSGGQEVLVTFKAAIEKDLDLSIIKNIAEVTNPEEPDKPLKPQVPTSIVPECPECEEGESPIHPGQPVDPKPEKPIDNKPEKPVTPKPEKPNGGVNSGNNTAPQTGDAGLTLMASSLLLSSLAYIGSSRKRKNK